MPVAHAERLGQAFAAAEMVITADEHVSARGPTTASESARLAGS